MKSLALSRQIDYQLNAIEDLINAKQIELVKEVESIQVLMNPYLADVLFLNLLKNAIFHNIEGGKIQIELNSDGFSISNSGSISPIPIKIFFFPKPSVCLYANHDSPLYIFKPLSSQAAPNQILPFCLYVWFYTNSWHLLHPNLYH